MDDLHIGVTTSRGNVVSYDFDGISEDTKNWQECLVVFQLDDKSLEKQWDTLLSDFVKNDRWNNDRLEVLKFILFYIFYVFLETKNIVKHIIYCLLPSQNYCTP